MKGNIWNLNSSVTYSIKCKSNNKTSFRKNFRLFQFYLTIIAQISSFMCINTSEKHIPRSLNIRLIHVFQNGINVYKGCPKNVYKLKLCPINPSILAKIFKPLVTFVSFVVNKQQIS